MALFVFFSDCNIVALFSEEGAHRTGNTIKLRIFMLQFEIDCYASVRE